MVTTPADRSGRPIFILARARSRTLRKVNEVLCAPGPVAACRRGVRYSYRRRPVPAGAPPPASRSPTAPRTPGASPSPTPVVGRRILEDRHVADSVRSRRIQRSRVGDSPACASGGTIRRMAAEQIELGLASTADARTLAQMARPFEKTGLGWSYQPRRIAELIRNPDVTTLAARDAACTAGFAIMSFGDERAHLVLLAVHPSRRRRGSHDGCWAGSSTPRRPPAWHRSTSSCAPTTRRPMRCTRRPASRPAACRATTAAARPRCACCACCGRRASPRPRGSRPTDASRRSAASHRARRWHRRARRAGYEDWRARQDEDGHWREVLSIR